MNGENENETPLPEDTNPFMTARDQYVSFSDARDQYMKVFITARDHYVSFCDCM